MKSEYKITDAYDRMLEDLITDEPSLAMIRNYAINIAIIESEKAKTSKGKKVIASLERVPDLYRELTYKDYIVTIYRPCLTGLSNEQIQIAIFEQLLKIDVGLTPDGNDVDSLAIRAYDYEGFKEIVDRYGTDWAEPWSRQLTMYDMTGAEEVADE